MVHKINKPLTATDMARFSNDINKHGVKTVDKMHNTFIFSENKNKNT